MAAFTFPDLTTIWTQTKALWSAERPNASIQPRSDVWLSTYITAKLWNRLHQTAGRVLDAVFPSTTYGVYLDYWLTMLGADNGSGGLGRIVARGSSGGTVTVVSTGAATVVGNETLTDAAGLSYVLTEAWSPVGADTTTLAIEAVDTGTATNLEAGAALTFTTPPANIVALTSLATDLDDGADLETDAAGRARLLELLRRGPSGSWSDWQQIIEAASPGNLDAYVWPKRENQPYGWGRTDYCALQRNETGVNKHIASSDALYTTIGNAITAALPVLLMRNSRQLTLTQSGVPVECTITLGDSATSDQACDWDAESVKLTVAARADPLITASAQIDGVLSVGDRVIIDGYEVTATEVGVADGLANTQFKIAVGAWPWGTGPAVGYNITSGGGLILDVIDDLKSEYFDSLGPARGDYAAPIPGWEDSVRVVGIQSQVIDTGDEAIVDVAVAAPAVTVSPTPGTGANTQRLVPTQITVWEAK